MIQELRIARFGKFRDATFTLGRVTLFCGPNEAGKTTLLDALRSCVCRPSRQLTRELRERYGREWELSLLDDEGRPVPADYEASEFLSLHAIRSGDLSIAWDKSSWALEAQKRIFSGGVSPQAVREGLLEKAGEDGRSRGRQRLNALVAEKESLTESLRNLERQRQETLGRLRLIADHQARCEGLEAEIGEVERALQERRTRASRLDALKTCEELRARWLKFQRLCDRMKDALRLSSRCDGELEELDAWEREEREGEAFLCSLASGREEKGKRLLALRADVENRKRGLASLERFARDELPDLEALESSLAAARASRGEAEAEEARQSLVFSESEQRLISLEEELAQLAVRLGEAGRGRSALVLSTLGMLLGILALALLVNLNFLFALFLPLLLWAWRVAGSGRAELKGQLAIRQADAAALRKSVARNRMAATQAKGRAESLRGREGAAEAECERWLFVRGVKAKDEYLRKLADFRRETADVSRLEAELADLGRNLETLERQCRGGEATIADLRRRRQRWLQERNLSSRDAFVQSLREKELCRRECEALRAELGIREGDEEVFKASLLRELESAERVAPSGVPAREPGSEKRELEELETTLAGLREAWRLEREKLEHLRGNVQGVLGTLPQQMAALQESVHRKTAELGEHELGLQAARLAAELFSRLDSDAEARFLNLSREVGSFYGNLVGKKEQENPVAMTGLGDDSFLVSDARGTARPPSALSAGTRDAFLLAMRIRLAEKMRPQGGFLIFDEPFPALDEERLRDAVKALTELARRGSWRLVFLTKEPVLCRALLEAFPETRVHELGR